MTNIADLNARYGMPGKITFKELPGGLAAVEAVNGHGAATVALQGGHLMTWTPRGGRPVIWLSRAASFAPGKSIRGGVPVCWPWFGPHPTEPTFPAHGFARTVPWELVAAEDMASGDIHLAFRLVQSEKTRAQWPYPAQLEIHITLGAALGIALVTRNTGAEPITIGEALHTYFEVSDIRRVFVQGLDGCSYLDKVDGGKRKQQSGAVTFGAETDRVYLDTSAECLIDDPDWQRRIRIVKQGSHTTVVWNPWHDKAAKMGDLGDNGYLNMLCVESANAAENQVTIAPGASHRLAVSYSVEALAAD